MADTEGAMRLFLEGYRKILEGIGKLGYDIHDENFLETDRRAAKAMAEMTLCSKDCDAEIAQMLSRTFPAKYEEMVISKHNVSFGVCPHHLLLVVYRISVAYIPQKQVLGISKLSRLTTLLARRPILQEDLTH